MSTAITGRPDCVPPDAKRSLPVLGPRVRRSNMGVRRALVLIAVHLVMIAHVLHWLWSGSTLTPVEPSEAMAFTKQGVVNAGLVLFALAILSTLLLGRWFCGWGCHLVGLQDLARWLLARVGIRPKPLRSGLLATVPLIAFLYMFIAPLVYHALSGTSIRPLSTHFFTDEFWATFPTWVPATLTFVICGFVIVYFLGAKGFCTNACPYGAAFGVADQLSPLRIRVTDACNQCGHCTSVCTSNVRVHEEVRDFKAVVDPGCMKCLDCVSVCPNDALYVGFGPPALLSPRTAAPRAVVERRAATTVDWPRRFLTGAFVFCSFAAFSAYDTHFQLALRDLLVALILTAVSLVTLGIFGGKRQARRSAGLWEDATLGLVFLLALLAFRGLYGLVAFLFALGLAAIVAYLFLHVLLALTRENLTLHGWRIRRAGRWQPAAAGLLALTGGLLLLGAHAALIQHDAAALRRLGPRIEALRAAALHVAAPAESQEVVPHGMQVLARLERRAWLPDPAALQYGAWLHLLAGDAAEFERRALALIEQQPALRDFWLGLGALYQQSDQPHRALALFQQWTQRRPRTLEAWLNLGLTLTQAGRFDEARSVYTEALRRVGDGPQLQQNMGILEAEAGRLAVATEHFQRAVALAPSLPAARLTLGRALLESGDAGSAIVQLRLAASLMPESPDAALLLASALHAAGDAPLARQSLEQALARMPNSVPIRILLADLCELLNDAPAAARHRSDAQRLAGPQNQ